MEPEAFRGLTANDWSSDYHTLSSFCVGPEGDDAIRHENRLISKSQVPFAVL